MVLLRNAGDELHKELIGDEEAVEQVGTTLVLPRLKEEAIREEAILEALFCFRYWRLNKITGISKTGGVIDDVLITGADLGRSKDMISRLEKVDCSAKGVNLDWTCDMQRALQWHI